MQDGGPDQSLGLTVEEAMGLLDIIMMSPGELTPDQRTAVLKLSDFCRRHLREMDPMKAHEASVSHAA